MSERGAWWEREAHIDVGPLLLGVDLRGVQRIDFGLEGNWSPTATTVWRRGSGAADFSGIVHSHPRHRPCLELYFDSAWFGLHCYLRHGNENIFDERLARAVIAYVEADLAKHS